MQKIVPHLWFDKEADEASKFYMSLFEGSKLKDKTILNDTPSGSVDMITIELAGRALIHVEFIITDEATSSLDETLLQRQLSCV